MIADCSMEQMKTTPVPYEEDILRYQQPPQALSTGTVDLMGIT